MKIVSKQTTTIKEKLNQNKNKLIEKHNNNNPTISRVEQTPKTPMRFTENYLKEHFDGMYTINNNKCYVKCQGRKELRQIIDHAKECSSRYTFDKAINESYKYNFTCNLTEAWSQISYIAFIISVADTIFKWQVNEDKVFDNFKELCTYLDIINIYEENKDEDVLMQNEAIMDYCEENNITYIDVDLDELKAANGDIFVDGNNAYILATDKNENKIKNIASDFSFVNAPTIVIDGNNYAIISKDDKYPFEEIVGAFMTESTEEPVEEELELREANAYEIDDWVFDEVEDALARAKENNTDVVDEILAISDDLTKDDAYYILGKYTYGSDFKPVIKEAKEEEPVEETFTTYQIFHKDDCAGVIEKLADDKYSWQNSNDMGLMMDMEETEDKVKVVDKIKLEDDLYIYEVTSEQDFENYPYKDELVSREEAIDNIKNCWRHSIEDKEEVKPITEDLKVIGTLDDYAPWGDAVELWNEIVDKDLRGRFVEYLQEMYPEGVTLETVNRLLSTNSKFIRAALGMNEETTEQPTGQDNPVEQEETVEVEEPISDTKTISRVERVNKDSSKYLSDNTGFGDDDLDVLRDLAQ